MTKLQGKRALVTGGSRGIGAAIARRLGAEGADVAITYQLAADAANRVVEEIRSTGRRAMAFASDSADDRAIDGVVSSVVAEFGGLDILVNNAGIFEVEALTRPRSTTSSATLPSTLRLSFSQVVPSFRISDREVVSSTSAVALLPECLVQASHCMR